MTRYERLKKYMVDNKQKFILTGCFPLVFLMGFGAGKTIYPKQEKPTIKSNYTVKQAEKPAERALQTPEVKTENKCEVKGSGSSKIYHVKGGAFYKRLKSPVCFANEADAKTAGFRKSSR